ncbi:MAG: 30S ribosomal protein S4 [Verrucomicrobiota bacterium]
MARYTGPRTKKSRRYGVPLFGPPQGARAPQLPARYARRQGPAQAVRVRHPRWARSRSSASCNGLLEKQFRRYYEIALRRRGVTGETLLQLLETRLDNVVFRLGLASSRRAARQMVNHGHVAVNGRRVSIASYNTKVGDVVEVRNNARSRQLGTRGPRRHADRRRARLAAHGQGQFQG